MDNNGVFKSAFVVHCAAVDVINAHGRPVCSTDFGHFKHDYFDGLNATGSCFYLCHWLCVIYVAFWAGLFQMGSGKLLAVWTAIFVNKSESNELWAECAEALKKAGVENLYNGVVHFRDRHTGCAVFEEKLQISRGMYCVPHILRNILQHKVIFVGKVLDLYYPFCYYLFSTCIV